MQTLSLFSNKNHRKSDFTSLDVDVSLTTGKTV